jgi:hypothetical protein
LDAELAITRHKISNILHEPISITMACKVVSCNNQGRRLPGFLKEFRISEDAE